MKSINIIYKTFIKTLNSSFFWEDARVMVIFSIVISLIIRLTFKKIAVISHINWLEFVPYLIYVIGILFGSIMMCMPNGTGNVTQHFYLGILMYSITMFFCTILIHILTKNKM